MYDLYYRLNVVEIDLPSLKERPDYVPILAQHFLDAFKKQMSKPIQGFTNEAMRALLQYQWKGEVRELENVIERAAIFCDEDFIGLEHLPDYMRPTDEIPSVSSGHGTLKDAVEVLSGSSFNKLLSVCGQNKETAAKVLGVVFSLIAKSKSFKYRRIKIFVQFFVRKYPRLDAGLNNIFQLSG